MATAMDLRDVVFRMETMATREVAMEQQLAEMNKRMDEIEAREIALAKQRSQDERKFLVTGILTLVAMVSALGRIIWAYRDAIIGGKP